MGCLTIPHLVCRLVCQIENNSWDPNLDDFCDLISEYNTILHVWREKTDHDKTVHVLVHEMAWIMTHSRSWDLWSKISSFLKMLSGEIWRLLGQNLDFGDAWGLYTGLHNLTRATRRKLVVVLTYKGLVGDILSTESPEIPQVTSLTCGLQKQKIRLRRMFPT